MYDSRTIHLLQKCNGFRIYKMFSEAPLYGICSRVVISLVKRMEIVPNCSELSSLGKLVNPSFA